MNHFILGVSIMLYVDLLIVVNLRAYIRKERRQHAVGR